jgi:hypothetical protein
MDELIAFWTARLDEEEHRATAEDYDLHLNWCAWGDLDRPAPCDCGNPARVLREVAADRLLLIELAGARQAYMQASSMCTDTRDRVATAKYDAGVTAAYAAWRALQRLAFARGAVWSDHPDYRREWKP